MVSEIPQPSVNLRGNIERYKRGLSKAFVDVFIDKSDSTKFKDNMVSLLGQETSRYDRVCSALKIIDSVTPRPLRDFIYKKFGYGTDRMPFDSKDYVIGSKLGSGGVNSVFLLSSQKEGSPSYVLKINHTSYFEHDPDKLLRIGLKQKKEYEEIKEKFKDVGDLIPAENYLLVHGIKDGKPAIVMTQPFMGENLRDLFNDFEKDELEYLLEKNPVFKEQLSKFTQITLSNNDLVEREFDLLGKNNLIVVGGEGDERLVLLDPHYRGESSRSLGTKEQIKRRVNYLKELTENVQDVPQNLSPQYIT